jgi:cytochrome c biogenesis protein CcdA/thiol-disulfide isomerase/thioredoxin
MNLIQIALILLFNQTPNITVHFFYSPSCGHCQDILLGDIPKLQKQFPFTLKKYDIDLLDNQKILEKMEEKVPDKTDEIPVVFVGDSAFYGPAEVRKKLGLTLKLLSLTIPVNPDTTKPPPDSVIDLAGPIHLYYFYQPQCPECDRTEALLRAVQKKYRPVNVYRYNILEDTSKLFYETLAEHQHVPENQRLLVPAIFIASECLIKEIPASSLEQMVVKFALNCPRLDTIRVTNAGNNLFNRFKKFSILGIMAAGFLDGINPCAFATIIFFVSYLIFVGRRRRDILLMAIFFILAVFASYLAIGLGAYKVLQILTGFKIVAKIVFLAFGIFAIILGVLSLYDYYLSRKGETSKMLLQLPLGIKQRIHKNIKEKTGSAGIIAGSIAAGVAVSFLEFGCTGQVYLPTITFIISQKGPALKPVASLVLYNLAFILPLIVIAFVAAGFSAKKVGEFLEKRIPIVKIVTAALFFALGILLLLTA